jgi:Tfp pilus assembly protein PilF
VKPTWILLIAALGLSGCPRPRPVVKAPDPAEAARARDAVRAFNRGVSLLSGRKANYHQAVVELEQAVALDPDFFDAHYNLGLLFDRGNDLARSEASYRRAIQIRPGDRPTLFNLASLYRKSNKLGEAIDLLEGFIELHPDDYEARNNLAVLYRMGKDYDKATAQSRYVLDHDPRQVLAYNNLATIFSEQGKHDMAEDLFRRALELEPDNPRVLNNLGLAKLKFSKVQEALEMFLRAWAKNPPLAEAGLNAASVYMANADYERAARIYQQVSERVPGTLPALVGHAVAERGLGRLDKAEQSYQQILGLDPTNPDTLFNLGLLYMNHRDKPAWACEAFQRFLRSGRAKPEEIRRANGYLEDLRLSHPKECPKDTGGKP